MHHIHIDRFARLTSPVHSLDPRAKLVCALAFVILAVLTPEGFFLSFALYTALLGSVLVLSRVSPSYILKRSLLLLPFALAISFFVPFITPGPVLWEWHLAGHSVSLTSTGLERFASLGFKAFLSFCAVILLVSTTRFNDLMWAAGRMGLHPKLVLIMSFMYRYLFIIVDEAAHMMLARDLRSPEKAYRPLIRASGGIIGAMWVRSYEHAEKLYYAMLLRGYTGQPLPMKTMRFSAHDTARIILFIAATVTGLCMGVFINE